MQERSGVGQDDLPTGTGDRVMNGHLDFDGFDFIAARPADAPVDTEPGMFSNPGETEINCSDQDLFPAAD